MNKPIVHLMLLEEGGAQAFIDMSCPADERFEVRERHRFGALTLPAAELSLYRHTLLLQGKAYRILSLRNAPVA